METSTNWKRIYGNWKSLNDMSQMPPNAWDGVEFETAEGLPYTAHHMDTCESYPSVWSVVMGRV